MKVTLLTSPIQVKHQTRIAIDLLSQCYQSNNMTFNKLLNIALVKKHQTVLECFDLTFLIKDISYASHVHFVRHRFTTPFVQSQRYTDAQVFRDMNNQIEKVSQTDRYRKPQGALINMGIKMNLREFMHVVELRTSPDAMKETQEIAKAMLEEVKKDEVLRRFFE